MKWFERSLCALFGLSLVVRMAGEASAFAGLMPVNTPGAEDYVFGPDGILYISTSGGNIDRYDTRTNTMLSPFNVGGHLLGMDISPDGKTLAVADTSMTGFDLVNTTTGAVTPVSYTPVSLEAGGFTVAFESNG
jgi:DNA-binding beta-propeller fold protein YncE